VAQARNTNIAAGGVCSGKDMMRIFKRPSYEAKSEADVGQLIRVVIPRQYRSLELQNASLVELIANALDAKPSLIEINLDRVKGVLEVTDNGAGMDKTDFIKYHNVVATTKGKGSTIGFAGQGAKLALNFCLKVVTETWSTSYEGYSEWQLRGNEAPYQIYDRQTPSLNHFGTKVMLYLDDKNKGFYTEDSIKQVISEHYFPLLDSELLKAYTGESPILSDSRTTLKIYKSIYKKGLKFIVNGKEVLKEPVQNVLNRKKEVSIAVYKKPKANGFFGLAKDGLPESLQGIAICTYGKVIERTWFKKEPRDKQAITGWIEAPYLIEAVTTDKCNFMKGNKLWEGFFRKTQAEFAKWLEEIGLSEKLLERKPDLSNLEREINSILKNLPELGLALFGSKAKADVAIRNKDGDPRKQENGIQLIPVGEEGGGGGGGVPIYPGPELGQAPTIESGNDTSAIIKPRTIRGNIRLGQEENPDSEKEARFDGETVIINVSHPAYKRAEKDKLVLNYHQVKSIALSLIEFNLDNDPEPSYQKAFELSQKFFTLWGKQ